MKLPFGTGNEAAKVIRPRGFCNRAGENEGTVQTTIGHLSDKGEDVDLLADMYGPIMDFLDLDYEWEREGEGEAAVTTLRMRQRGAA
jgi:hypothetical protein